MDPNNPIVKLCVAGMRAEGENRFEEARLLFTQAWESSTDDFEACIAAHFLARHQENPQDTLRWNQEALARAEAVGDDRVSDFYPSLYLNLGHAHETLGDMEEAARFYGLASQGMDRLPDSRLSGIVRGAVEAGQKRLSNKD
jgi:tetratricopeptide (TPR) repeat protein